MITGTRSDGSRNCTESPNVAISDYRKLEKPKDAMLISTSTYQLAQNRLKAMGASGPAAGK